MQRYLLSILFLFIYCTTINAQVLATKADKLRGSINANRSWWDVTFYDLTITPNIKAESIVGKNSIQFKVLASASIMQMDLQQPLKVVSISYKNKPLKYKREGNVILINFPLTLKIGSVETIEINYNGIPRKAIRAPWDGGIVWQKDEQGRPFINTACQGLGASVWWPCKDHQSDEPDSMQMTFVVPKDLVAVGNGRLKKITEDNKGNKAYTWLVKNPINNYGATMNIGNYVHFSDTLNGEKGLLNLEYWVIDYNLDKAKKQFVQGKQTIKAFEYWFGPYPFYEDSYKLVETHHLGMEHQSAVAYGNKFKNGYLGGDLSYTGWGLKWDYIIVHESGHEWWGNSITTNDIADMWVHEGLTDYSETLFTEYYYGKEAGNAYNKGQRLGIENTKPIIGEYGLNKEGSGDMYPKGANIIHTIRQLINDDIKFREILRGLQKDFYHKNVNTADVENYISTKSGINFSKVFDQYLRNTDIPILKYYTNTENGNTFLNMKFTNCINGFKMNFPIDAHVTKDNLFFIEVKDDEYIKLKLMDNKVTIQQIINPNIYIELEEKK
jgi:aminopeptidase N